LTEIKHENHDFICPICLKYIVAATTTHCGHTFCEICISEYLLFYSVPNKNKTMAKFSLEMPTMQI